MSIEYTGTRIIKNKDTKDLIEITFSDCEKIITLFYQVVFVTPLMAEKFLSKNINNRNISSARVKLFSNLMKRYQWFPFSTIMFDQEGKLLDGQHRIASVLQSGAGAYFIVIKGVPKEWMMGIDAGRSRTFTDISKFFDRNERNTHLAIARYLEMGLTRNVHQKIFSRYDEMEIVDKYKEPVTFAVDHVKKVRGATAPALYAVARAYYTMDVQKLVRFCNILKTGMTTSEKEKAVITLRDWMMDPVKTSSQGGVVEVYYKTLTAINDFNKGVAYSVPKLTLGQLEEKYPITD